ncbi:MAG: glycerophosphodiester phosphodiesterase family protein, partial [Pseudonocardiaceae bacterium]
APPSDPLAQRNYRSHRFAAHAYHLSRYVEAEAKLRSVRLGLLAPVTAFGITAVLVAPESDASSSGTAARPILLAHRGLAQTFDVRKVDNDTCTAKIIHPPQHPDLENSIASMRAAFADHADIVEFDVQRTKDDQFVVFHDSTLQCCTEGTRTVREHSLAELRRHEARRTLRCVAATAAGTAYHLRRR